MYTCESVRRKKHKHKRSKPTASPSLVQHIGREGVTDGND